MPKPEKKKPAIPLGNMAGISQQQIDMLQKYAEENGVQWWDVTPEMIATTDKNHKDNPSGYKAGDENLTPGELADAKKRAADNAVRGPQKVQSDPQPSRSATQNKQAEAKPAQPVADYVKQTDVPIAQYSAKPDTYNDQVKAIQKALMNAGHSVGKAGADGYWGDSTAAALEAAGLKTEARGSLTEQRAQEILKYLEDKRAKSQAGYNS